MADMYGIKLGAGRIDPLGKQGLVVLNPETRDEGVSGAEEKNTQNPREDVIQYGWRLGLHGSGPAGLKERW